MADPSPARLFATLAGAFLLALGIAGFFYSASFGAPGDVGEAFGAFEVNGWLNLVHGLTGAAGLLLAGVAPRRYSLFLGCGYVVLAIWGLMLGSGEAVLGFLPVDAAGDILHLAVGVLGIGAALGTRRQGQPATA
jgi:hypothetical protein